MKSRFQPILPCINRPPCTNFVVYTFCKVRIWVLEIWLSVMKGLILEAIWLILREEGKLNLIMFDKVQCTKIPPRYHWFLLGNIMTSFIVKVEDCTYIGELYCNGTGTVQGDHFYYIVCYIDSIIRAMCADGKYHYAVPGQPRMSSQTVSYLFRVFQYLFQYLVVFFKWKSNHQMW